MDGPHERDLMNYLGSGRRLLQTAPDTFGRALSPQEYWWLGVGLAATTLAELGGFSFAVGRLGQLIDRAGYKGIRGDWLQRFVEELAELNAEGLLWPVYERNSDGQVGETGVVVCTDFDAESAYFVALGHIGVAVSVHAGNQPAVDRLAPVIAALIASGRTAEHEQVILSALAEAQEIQEI